MRFLVNALLAIFEVLAEESGELVVLEDKEKTEKITKERERERKVFFFLQIYSSFHLNLENLYQNIISAI